MKVLLTGSSGQLGQTISNLKPQEVDLILLERKDLDLRDFEKCKSVVKEICPEWVINCGAYTNVDKAEIESEIAIQINGKAPKAFAEALRESGGNLLQISTDFVFNGKSKIPYKVNDKKDPICMYGISKAVGEKAIEEILEPLNQSIILRTSWVISPYSKNFLLTMLNLHKNKDIINVVSDQIGRPTSTFSLSKACWSIIMRKRLSKNFPKKMHFSNSGIASWFDLAFIIGEIAEELSLINKKALVKPIFTKDYPTPAQRPAYSVLDISETVENLAINPVHWKDAVKDILIDIKKVS